MTEDPELRFFILRDGTRVRVRPIRPEDKAALQEGMHELTLESRYRRFMSAPNDLSKKELRYLTEVDQVNHIALVAADEALPEKGIGAARCIRLQGEPTVAEPAVTILDTYQGRGLGTLLLGLISLAAADQGIQCFRAYVLGTNTPMIDILEQIGGHSVGRDGSAEWYDVPLLADPTQIPHTPAGRVFRALLLGQPPPRDAAPPSDLGRVEDKDCHPKTP